MKYIIGNWKSNKNIAEVKAWAARVKKSAKLLNNSELAVVICPSFIHIPVVADLLPEITLGAQTLSPYPNGSYTGAVSALLASEFVKFAILGHTERRMHFGETNQIIANQAIQALENHITPIVAVDKTNWSSQLSQFDPPQLKNMLVMYEPPDAISSNAGAQAADIDDVKAVVQLIKNEYAVKGVLYGGSVSPANISTYMNEQLIDGVVPGAASLDADEFVAMIQASI